MSKVLGFLSLFIILNAVQSSAQKTSKLITTPPMATVEGRVTVHMTVGRTFGEHPVGKLPLYLLHVDDSKALQTLQRRCRTAVAHARGNAYAAYETCTESLADAARLVPKMHPTATTETDRDGNFKFESVPAGGRYQVVGIRYDGEDPVVIVGQTPRLRGGQQCKVDLSENDAWTDALPSAL